MRGAMHRYTLTSKAVQSLKTPGLHGDGNTEIFDKLAAHRDKIEHDFGGSLEWGSLEGKRACHKRKTVTGGGWQEEDKWPEIYDNFIDPMINLEKTLRPWLKKL
jgi:hypothetical protein